MPKQCRTFNFGGTMKIWMLLTFCTLSLNVFAQQKTIDGIVFDKESKDRIAKVHIFNITSGKSVYNTFKGEFTIDAQAGDVLVFQKYDHFPDTLKIKNADNIAVYMKRTAIQLPEVTVHDTLLNPQKQLAATHREYSKIYGSLDNHDLLSIGPGGAGLGIDALYNAFSRSGRNAERLRQTIELDYKQNVIDYRFNRTYVGAITNLKDQQLTEFMYRYRPGYFLVKTATDYEFIASIRNNLRRYLRSKRSYTIAPLITPKVDETSAERDKMN